MGITDPNDNIYKDVAKTNMNLVKILNILSELKIEFIHITDSLKLNDEVLSYITDQSKQIGQTTKEVRDVIDSIGIDKFKHHK